MEFTKAQALRSLDPTAKWMWEWTANEYQRQRARAYPSWTDQLDYIYHNGIDKWKTDVVDPVKAKYPKPS